jgi:hypothetical protein
MPIETNFTPDPRTLPEVQFVPDIPDASGSLTGFGSPEGVVVGAIGQHYWDKTNRTDYIKTSGSGSTGWEIFLGI